MTDSAPITYSTTITEREMRLTPAAEAKMAELLAGADPDIKGIRVFVSGGGCSGMTYGMTYAEAETEYDSTLDVNGCRIVVDAVALNYLQGCEIDFAEDQFRFKSVFQAVGGSGTCGGCGGGGC